MSSFVCLSLFPRYPLQYGVARNIRLAVALHEPGDPLNAYITPQGKQETNENLYKVVRFLHVKISGVFYFRAKAIPTSPVHFILF